MPPCVFGNKAPPWRQTGSVSHLWIVHLLLLCVTSFLPGVCKVVPLQASLNSTVELPCHYAIAPEESLLDYRVYWQIGKIVVHVLMEGRHEVEYQDKRYLNRTYLDHNNLSLSLSGVQVSDEGSYSCYIQKRDGTGPGFKSISVDYSVLLSVTAAYSQPVISQEETPDNTCCVNLICLSQGGYPEASVVWYNLTGEHVIPESHPNTSFRDPVSHLYNVTSWLVVDISTCLVVCSVQSQRLPAVNSSDFTPERCKPVPEPKKNSTLAIGICIAFTIVVLVVSFLLIKYCAPCSRNTEVAYAGAAEQRRDNIEEAKL